MAILDRVTRATVAMVFAAGGPVWCEEPVPLRITVAEESGVPLPSRVHLYAAGGSPMRAAGLPFWHDHFVCPGSAVAEVAPGRYRLEVERGPAWSRQALPVEVGPGAGGREVEVELRRLVDPAALGWFDADLHVHRPPEEIALHLAAEDLRFAPVTTWWNDQDRWAGTEVPDRSTTLGATPDGRWFDLMAGEDERGGGALLYFGLDRPLAIGGAQRETPSSVEFAEEARSLHPGVHLDAEKPFWWDFPVWAAHGLADTVGIAHNHLHRSGVLANEAWGRPRDTARHPGPHGNGRWTLEIYDRLLDAGFRIPPSAGSASGVLPNPVGYNRVYVHLGAGAEFEPDAWWDGLRKGRSFVTNGPLLFVELDGAPPGQSIRLGNGGRRTVTVAIRVVSNDPLRELGVARQRGGWNPIEFDPESRDHTVRTELVLDGPGWFAVRAVADVDATFRFASTAPCYVETADGQPAPPDADAVGFFQSWLGERRQALETELEGPGRDRVLRYHREAAAAWAERAELATEPGAP